MTVIFEQTGTSFTVQATDILDGLNFSNPQAMACLVTNTGGNAVSVQYDSIDTGPQYAQWPAEGVPGFGTIIQPGTQQVLLTNTYSLGDASAYATYVCAGEDTTTLVFNLGTV